MINNIPWLKIKKIILKKINTIKQLCEKYMILKLEKGNAVVLVNKIDYQNAIKQLFFDETKFKIFKNDPTLTRLEQFQI